MTKTLTACCSTRARDEFKKPSKFEVILAHLPIPGVREVIAHKVAKYWAAGDVENAPIRLKNPFNKRYNICVDEDIGKWVPKNFKDYYWDKMGRMILIAYGISSVVAGILYVVR